MNSFPHPISSSNEPFTEDHPAPTALEAFSSGTLDGPTAMKVSNHLLRGCAVCSRLLRKSPQANPDLQQAQSTPSAVAWVLKMLARPAEGTSLILANSPVPPADEVAIALAHLASQPPLSIVSADPSTAPKLLNLALATLNGEGLASPQRPERRADLSLRTRLTHQLCDELIKEGSLEPAIEAVITLNDQPETDDAHSRRLQFSSANRAPLLLLTATVLRAASEGGYELSGKQRERLPAACERSALIEAQQLLQQNGEDRLHTECLVRLAELMLQDSENTPPKISDLPDLIEGLALHARRCRNARQHPADAPNSLELITRHYLLNAHKRHHDLKGAHNCCTWLIAAYEEAGDHNSRLLMELERARLLKDQGDAAEALESFEEARRGLLLSGQPSAAAIATLESIELQMESGFGGGPDLGTALSAIFASGALGPESLTHLLLVRESYLEGRLRIAQVRYCLELIHQDR